MTLKKAMTILYKECEFLGMNFNDLENFLLESPGAFSSETIAAHRRYLDHLAWLRLQMTDLHRCRLIDHATRVASGV